MVGFILGYFVISNQQRRDDSDGLLKGMWEKVDFSGALLLVTALCVQLLGLSLGGNELPWSNGWVIGSLVGSFVLLGVFVWIESRTSAMPIIPLRMLSGRLSVSIQLTNVCAGLAAYAVCLTKVLKELAILTGCSICSCYHCSSKSCY